MTSAFDIALDCSNRRGNGRGNGGLTKVGSEEMVAEATGDGDTLLAKYDVAQKKFYALVPGK